MSRKLTVHADSAAMEIGSVRAVVASIPESLAFGGPEADVRAICGSPGWSKTAAAAVRSGVLGIVVIQPQPEGAFGLQSLARERSVPIVIDYLWASNPVVAHAVEQFRAYASEAVLVDVRVDVDDTRLLQAGVLESLVLLKRLVGPLKDVRHRRTHADGFTVTAALVESGSPVTVSGAVSSAFRNEVLVRMITTGGSIEVAIPHPATARPATLTSRGRDGAFSLPTIYESAHRSSWKRLLDLQRSRRTAFDLEELDGVAALMAWEHLPPPTCRRVRTGG